MSERGAAEWALGCLLLDMAGCFLCAIRRFAHLDVCCARILLKYLPINDKPMIDPKRDFIPLTQNYDRLKAYQKSECIYDVTYYFAHRFLGRGDRTVDQMVQAARSGKQNIAEGVEAGATSCETAIKLVNVARASLQELLLDYKDYLRVRNLDLWLPGSDKYEQCRRACMAHNESAFYRKAIAVRTDTAIANIAITLIYQADVLLRGLIERLKCDFVERGGIREEMTRVRLQSRKGRK